MAAARLNQHAIYQRYTTHMHKLADKMPQDKVRLASIKGTIRRTFGFKDGQLVDTLNNIQRINAVQDESDSECSALLSLWQNDSG